MEAGQGTWMQKAGQGSGTAQYEAGGHAQDKQAGQIVESRDSRECKQRIDIFEKGRMETISIFNKLGEK